jgi:hypothetical protein
VERVRRKWWVGEQCCREGGLVEGDAQCLRRRRHLDQIIFFSSLHLHWISLESGDLCYN